MRRFGLALLLVAAAAPLAASPEAARRYLDSARVALDRSDGIAAEADLQRALAAGAERPVVAADMGQALLLQGDRAKAREWLSPGQFASGSAARGWQLLGQLEGQEGDLAAAGRAFDRALSLNPDDPALWVDIGRLRYRGAEHLSAIEAAKRALALGPANPRALEFMAQLVRDSLGDEAALPLLERGLAAAPGDLLLLGGQAASLGELGEARAALAATRQMLELDPQNGAAFQLQAVIAARAGKVDLARAMLARSGARSDAVPAAMLLAAVLELEAGNANSAAQKLLRLADLQPANVRVQMLLARALYESGDHQTLLARFGAAAMRTDAPAYLLTLLGRAEEERGDRLAAAALLDRASAAAPAPLEPAYERDPAAVLGPRWNDDPGNASLVRPYLRAVLAAGDTGEAARVAERFLALHPGSAEAHALGGDVALISGRPLDALRGYEVAASVRFSDQLMLRTAIALDRAGRGGEVMPLVRSYLRRFPSSRLAMRLAANLAISRQDWAEARLLLENLRLRGGNRDAGLLADLSLAQLRSGDADAALETATRSWHLAPASLFAVQARLLVLSHREADHDIARQLLAQANRGGLATPLLAEARRKLR